MIYVSSACASDRLTSERVERLAKAGFRSIELTGGGAHEPGLIDKLLEFQERFGLDYLCHNYFPPPEEPFVLNLATRDEAVAKACARLINEALDACVALGSPAYSIHAGFRIDPGTDELGGPFTGMADDPSTAWSRFMERLQSVRRSAKDRGLELYVENNVCIRSNVERFGRDALFLSEANHQLELLKAAGVRLLLDVGHLKVSCATLGHCLGDQICRWLPLADYIHVSDNDGARDQNAALKAGSELHRMLQAHNTSHIMRWTVEVYDGVDSVNQTIDAIGSASR